MRLLSAFLFISSLLAQTPSATVLERKYHDGETLNYQMKATNDGNHYAVKASGIVKRNASGAWVEEYRWSDLVWAGNAVPPTAQTEAFRQILSLDPTQNPAVPNLASVDPKLIGPITDLLTFYADLWLAERKGGLKAAGDHLYYEHGTPNSWADGNFILLGQDSIDFDITLKSLSPATAVLLVKHVPPAKPQIKIPADWMQERAADTPNNWVNVVHAGSNYIAQIGKETFDVEFTINRADGKILSGSIHNPIDARERICQDADLKTCGDAHPRKILRDIEIQLIP